MKDLHDGSWVGVKGHESADPWTRAKTDAYNAVIRRRALGLSDDASDEEYEEVKRHLRDRG